MHANLIATPAELSQAAVANHNRPSIISRQAMQCVAEVTRFDKDATEEQEDYVLRTTCLGPTRSRG